MESQFASHDHKSAGMEPASHPASQPENRITDNWASEPGSHRRGCRAGEKRTSKLRSCSWSAKWIPAKLEAWRAVACDIARNNARSNPDSTAQHTDAL